MAGANQTKVYFARKEDEKKNDVRYFPTMIKIVNDKIREK